MVECLKSINAFVWGIPVLGLILCVGVGLSIATGFWQINNLPKAMKYFLKSVRENSGRDGVSGYQALCNALAATVGTGNLAGVAGAISIGGPGAIFWMWISGILGMMIKFAEVVLAMRYRNKDVSGGYIGGPMYVIQNTMPQKWHFLAYIYCFFGVVALFGVGNSTQINAIMDAIDTTFLQGNHQFTLQIHLMIGFVIAVLIFLVFHNGGKKIGQLTTILVPLSAGVYILLSLCVIALHMQKVPGILCSIVQGAFKPASVTGGIVGSFFTSLRTGTARGVFTNEAGMGTASIVHAESQVTDPLQQGLLGIVEVFLDTIVICTLTALVILCSGISIPYGTDPGVTLTISAFTNIYGSWVNVVLSLIICALASATILGWGLYGLRCAQFLFGKRIYKYFAWFQAVAVLIGVVLNTSTVWVISELVNGLMAIPNMIAILYLIQECVHIIKTHR